MISDFNKRITVTRYASPTQKPSGGLVQGVIDETFSKWAHVENRSGGVSIDSAQREWNYDYKITVRYTPSNVERSSDVITYDDKTLLIRSVSFENEGMKRFVVLRCSNNE